MSAVFVSLPLKEQNPKTLLRKIKRQMDRLKSYPDVFIVFALITILVKWLPSEMFIRVQNWFYGKNTLLLSNVPGRKSDAYFAGAKVNDMYFWVPLIGSGALGEEGGVAGRGLRGGGGGGWERSRPHEENLNRTVPQRLDHTILTLLLYRIEHLQLHRPRGIQLPRQSRGARQPH